MYTRVCTCTSASKYLLVHVGGGVFFSTPHPGGPCLGSSPKVFPRKLVSDGGLDVRFSGLAPFEISVPGGRRAAVTQEVKKG